MLEQIFLQVLNMSLKAGAVIILVLAARLLLCRAPKGFSYALWSVVLFRLLCPFSLQWAFSLLPTRAEPIPMDIMYARQPQISTGLAPVDGAVNSLLPAPEAAASVNPLQIWTLLGGVLWLAGMLALVLYSLISLYRLRRRLRDAVQDEEGIWTLNGLETPFVLGVLRPGIYLPAGLTAAERRYILLHERTHIRRGDHLLRLAAFAALCLHWFNPLVWLAFFLSGRDMEMSCDERVLRTLGSEVKRDYSSSLLTLATGRRWVGGTPLAFGEGDTKSRIQNVLRWKKPAAWAAAAAAVLVLALCVGLAADREEQDLSFLNPDNLIATTALSGQSIQVAEYEQGFYRYLPGSDVARWIDDTRWTRQPAAQPYDYTPTYELMGLAGANCSIRLYREAPRLAMVFYEDRFQGYQISEEAFDRLEQQLMPRSFAIPFADSPYTSVTLTEHRAEGAQPSVTFTDANLVKQLFSLVSFTDADRSDGRGGPVPEEHLFLSFRDDSAVSNYFLYQRDGVFYLQTADQGQWAIAPARAEGILELFSMASQPTPMTEIPRLIDAIASAELSILAASSNPGDYIRARQELFDQLLTYGDDTLTYCFTRFAAGGETGLPGHVMMQACRTLCAEEDIDLNAATGQEWFDAFHQAALSGCRQIGAEEFSRRNPRAFLLLVQLGEAPENQP